MNRFVDKLWYQSNIWAYALWPIHLIFYCLVTFRRMAYRVGWLKQQSFQTPVIVVGNISVGGTGKTPMIIWLVKYLQQKGLSVVVVSRGYGRQSKEPLTLVTENSSVETVGDEPKLINMLTGAHVVVSSDRPSAIRFAEKRFTPAVIISDDGLQHYAMNRDAEICMVDGYRWFGNEMILPAGPLREPLKRKDECDLVIQNSSLQRIEHYAKVVALNMINLQSQEVVPANEFSAQGLTAVCAIGNPEKFSKTLQQLGLEHQLKPFHDHHLFSLQDFDSFGDGPVIMTAKDAIKCVSFAKPNWWYLEVEFVLEAETESALDKLINKIVHADINTKGNGP